MIRAFILTLLISSSAMAAWADDEFDNSSFQSLTSGMLAQSGPNNCVNPGGGCDGSVQCCSPNQNFCVRNHCQSVPQIQSEPTETSDN
jgi:uncharacterized protein (DUF779 family)